MHLKQVSIFPQKFPAHNCYPFNLELFRQPKTVDVCHPVTFFVGENGTGKSTLLQAISRRCGICMFTLRTCRRSSAGDKIRHRSLQRTLNGRSTDATATPRNLSLFF